MNESVAWRKTPMTRFGEVLHKHGSDKSTNHCYDPVYEKLFPDPLAVKSMLEIGVSFGGSVLAWHELFPNARIAGLDTDECPKCPRLDRMSIHIGTQADKEKLDEVTGTGRMKFDLIIDDASHRIEHQLLSLFWLWPCLKPGGYYVIEEFDQYSPRGQGSPENHESLKMFRGVQLYDLEGPAGPQMLVVIKKEKP